MKYALLVFCLSLHLMGCSSDPTVVSPSCQHGTTNLDGVCVTQGIADYASCVRSQGASVDRGSMKDFSITVGNLVTTGAADWQIKDQLTKKYAASDSVMHKIVDQCNKMTSFTGNNNRPAEVAGSDNEKSPSATDYVKSGEFGFKLNGCEQNAGGVFCGFVAKNLGNVDRTLWLQSRLCYCTSNEGDRYAVKWIYIGDRRDSNGTEKIKFKPDMPLKIGFRCEGVDPSISRFHSIVLGTYGRPDAVFKGVYVQQ